MATYQKVVSESSSGTISQNTSGNAATATALATSRTLAVSGDITGSGSFNGSANLTISTSLAADSVAANEIADGAVGTAAIADDAITAAKIAANAVGSSEIAADAVGASEIAAGAVGASEIAANAVGASELADNSVDVGALNTANTASNGQLLQYDSTDGLQWADATGDITQVTITAGTGLSGGGSTTSGHASHTLAVDLSELTDMTAAMVSTDEFIVLDNGADRRKAASEIGLSIFNNDSGFTTNTGTVTSVATGTGIAGGTITGSGTISLALSELTVGSTFTAGADAIPFHDDGAGNDKLAESGTIPVSFFNNDANYVTTSRSLSAGNGLTGGGNLSANRTFAVGAGTGVTVTADAVSIGQSVATSASPTFAGMTLTGDLVVGGSTITTNTETLEIADNTLILNSDLGSSSAGVDAGFVVERGNSGDNACLFYDNSAAQWKVGTSSSQALPSDGAAVQLQKVTATLDTTDESVPVGGFQVANGVAFIRTA